MSSSRESRESPVRPRRQAPLRPRLAATRQLVGDRQRASDRLRRSLWVSLLAHGLLLLVISPLALHSDRSARVRDLPPLKVERVELDPLEFARLDPQSPPADQPPEPTPQVPEDQALVAAVDPETPLELPEPPQPPPPTVTELLEFVRAHQQASDSAPDAGRISTQDQRVDHERVSPARAQVADGSSDRGTQAGTPQQATRAGAKPEQPAPATPLEREAQAQARQAAATPRPPRALTQRDDEHPCPGGASAAAGPCDALADAHGTPQGAHDRGRPARVDGTEAQSHAPHQAASRLTSPGWAPIAVRLPGQVASAQPFPEAPLPDRPSSPGAAAPHDALLQATASQHPRPDKEARAPLEQRREQAQQQRLARPQGSSLPAPEPEPSELASKRVTPPEPELRFMVEPLDLMRQEQEREQQAQASERNNQKQRRRAAQGSSRPTAASPSGSQAAAGGSVVSPIDPPQALDVQTVLATRAHPLAQALQVLDDQLRASWVIPFEIRVSGIVGTTGLELVLDKRGRIRDVTTTRPSGHAHLDELARTAIPERIEDFDTLLEGEAREAFPRDGLRVYYEFEYRDSPVAGVL